MVNHTTSVFHHVGEGSEFEILGNQAEGPCLRLGSVPLDTAEHVLWALEAAWQRDDEWRNGYVDPGSGRRS